jgi:MFS family permease
MRLVPARTPSEARAKWLNSTVLGIGLASLCSDVGHEMATTAMPALLASLGAASAALGLIEGVADGLSSFAKLFSGAFSDRLERRKPLAVAGYFVTASGMGSFALATQWWHVLLGRVGGWVGRGARTPVRNVLLTEATTAETYGRAFGLERAMDSAGAIVGPSLALLIGATLGLRWIFALTLVPGILAALVVALFVKERPHQPRPDARLVAGLHGLPRPFRRYLAGVGLAGLGDFSNTLLILWASQAWTPAFGAARAATLAMLYYVGYNCFYTASCYVSGHLADRLPRHRVLAAGYSLACVPAMALLWPGASFVKFGVVFAVSGVYMGVWETVESTTAAAVLPEAVRGVGFGTLATVNGIGDLVSSALVGFLWAGSPIWAMSFVIATSLGGAAVIATTRMEAP